MNMVDDISERGNRALNRFSKRNPFHEMFPREFNSFADDRIALRTQANTIYQKISSYLFDDINISRKVLIGKNHCFFYNGENDTVQNYQRTAEYSQSQYKELKKHIDKIKEFCDANGIKLYFMIPPNKSTIYPEFYPDFIDRLDKPMFYETLADYINNNVDVTFVNIYDNMMKAKDNYVLYYKQDTHWNSTGAYFAYQMLAEAIAKDFPNFAIVQQNQLSRCDAESRFRDLTNLLGGYGYDFPPVNEFCLKEPVTVKYEQKTDPAKNLMGHLKTSYTTGPKIMMFHDSFIGGMENFIYNGVSESKGVWFYQTSPLAYEKEILEYKPDIIIWEILEKYATAIMEGNMSYKRP